MVLVRDLHRLGQQGAEQTLAGVIRRLRLRRQGAQCLQAAFQPAQRLRALIVARRQPGGDLPREGGIPVNAGAGLVRLGDGQAIGGLLPLADAQGFPQLRRAGINRLPIFAQGKHIIQTATA